MSHGRHDLDTSFPTNHSNGTNLGGRSNNANVWGNAVILKGFSPETSWHLFVGDRNSVWLVQKRSRTEVGDDNVSLSPITFYYQ